MTFTPNKSQYNTLTFYRNLHDENLPLTSFTFKMFNGKMKHTSNGMINNSYQHPLDHCNVTITFNNDKDYQKFMQIINQDGPHYTKFLLKL